jgi:hypothetical protein
MNIELNEENKKNKRNAYSKVTRKMRATEEKSSC